MGLTFVGMFFYFRPRGEVRTGWEFTRILTGMAYTYSGMLCLAGVVAHEPLIERSMLPLSVALLLQLILALPATDHLHE